MTRRLGLLLLIGLVALSVGAGVARARRLDHAPRLKPPIVGLVDKGVQAPYALSRPFPTTDPAEIGPDGAAFTGIVVNVGWRQLEPAAGRFRYVALDRSLAAVTAYDLAHRRHQLSVKLRVWGGLEAPAWAKRLGGPPVTFDVGRTDGQMGRWWTGRYRRAWSGMQHALAARYDLDPLIAAVAVTSCATLTGEPFVFSPNRALLVELQRDGWSSAAQQRCLSGAFHDYSGWRATAIDYTFNPFVLVSDGTRLTRDQAFTDRTMTTCAELRERTGRRCILSNHALTAVSATLGGGAPIYAEMGALRSRLHGHVEVDLQTYSPDTFGGCQAIDVAVGVRARSLELWPPGAGFPGFRAFPESELRSWAGALARERPIGC